MSGHRTLKEKKTGTGETSAELEETGRSAPEEEQDHREGCREEEGHGKLHWRPSGQ